MFSSEICEIFKNTYFIQYLRWLLLKLRMQKPQKKLIHVIYLRTTIILRKSRHWWNCNRISKKTDQSIQQWSKTTLSQTMFKWYGLFNKEWRSADYYSITIEEALGVDNDSRLLVFSYTVFLVNSPDLFY